MSTVDARALKAKGLTRIAFVHIPKNAGSHVTWLLRSYFGTSHCRVVAEDGVTYRLADWQRDAIIYPRLRCLSGHRLRPYADFGQYEQSLQWATVLREPHERFASQYRWYCKKRNLSWSFEQWCENKGQQFANYQSTWLSGEPSAEKAWGLIERKQMLLGNQADLEAFLVALARRAGLRGFPLGTGRRVNATAGNAIAGNAIAGNATGVSEAGVGTSQSGCELELLARYNAQDMALYQRCCAQKRFVAAGRGTGRILGVEKANPRRIPYYLNLAKHVGLYKPYRRLWPMSASGD